MARLVKSVRESQFTRFAMLEFQVSRSPFRGKDTSDDPGAIDRGDGVAAGGITLAQLKIMQEVITLALFVPFAMLYMGEGLKWNYLWAALCMMGAVYFIFKA